MDVVNNILWTGVGLVLFGLAFLIHRKGATGIACVVAVLASLAFYASPIGSWANGLASKFPVAVFAGVAVGIIVIIADIKGRRRGADLPALVAFFLVPAFFVAFLSTIPRVFDRIGDGAEKFGDAVTSQMER